MRHDLQKAVFPKVKRSLQTLGERIKASRLARNMTASELALRANTSLATVKRIEKGDPSAAIIHWASCFFVLGLLEKFTTLSDPIGTALVEASIRKRARKMSMKELAEYDF